MWSEQVGLRDGFSNIQMDVVIRIVTRMKNGLILNGVVDKDGKGIKIASFRLGS